MYTNTFIVIRYEMNDDDYINIYFDNDISLKMKRNRVTYEEGLRNSDLNFSR